MKRAIIIHGWGGNPKESWLPWLKEELTKKGYTVYVPVMPNTKSPDITTWVNTVRQILTTPDEETIMIGHSIGCQTILRYLETINVEIGTIALVAGWMTLKPGSFESEEEREIAKPWETTPLDWKKIRNNISKAVCIFSDNDDCVDLKEAEIFKELLNAEIIILHNKGHFSGSDNITKIPILLEKLD